MRSVPLLAGLLVSACAAVPHLGPAPKALSATDVAASRSLAAPAAGAAWPGQGWWHAYGDPQLDALVNEGLTNSPDVAAAIARFRRAGAMAQQAGAALLPRVDAAANIGLERQSLNMGFPDAFKAFLPQGWNDAGTVNASIGFDPDLWGRNRAALAAATSEARAAAVDAQQARLALAAGIVSAYLDLDRLNAEREVLAREVGVAEAARKLLGERRANGLENRAPEAGSEAQLANARVALNQADEALALRRNQLAALVGAGPDRGLAITPPKLADAAIVGVPDNVTTELLGRRPDVVASRERVEAAAARIREARADFFPAIRLSALIGFQSLGLDTLFSKGSTYGSVGPAVSLPIFHGGELRGRYRGARADFDAAVASYNGTVLGAYQQTADALVTTRTIGARLAEARRARDASQDAYNTALLRYKGGLSPYLEVLDAENRLLQSGLALVRTEEVARTAQVSLIRALGGGYLPGGADQTRAGTDKRKEDIHG